MRAIDKLTRDNVSLLIIHQSSTILMGVQVKVRPLKRVESKNEF